MKKCKVCKSETENKFNIEFKATPICEDCANSIMLQQVSWLAKTAKENKYIDYLVNHPCNGNNIKK